MVNNSDEIIREIFKFFFIKQRTAIKQAEIEIHNPMFKIDLPGDVNYFFDFNKHLFWIYPEKELFGQGEIKPISFLLESKETKLTLAVEVITSISEASLEYRVDHLFILTLPNVYSLKMFVNLKLLSKKIIDEAIELLKLRAEDYPEITLDFSKRVLKREAAPPRESPYFVIEGVEVPPTRPLSKEEVKESELYREMLELFGKKTKKTGKERSREREEKKKWFEPPFF